MEGRGVDVLHGSMLDVDLKAPRKGRRTPEQLLVDPVPPATDGLRHRDSWRQRITEGRQRDTATTHADPRADPTEDDGTPDTEAAFPYSESPERVSALAEVRLRRRDDVVDAATDDSEGNSPDRDICHDPAFASAGAPAPITDPDGKGDADDDGHRIAPQGKETDVPDAITGTGDGEHHALAPTTGLP